MGLLPRSIRTRLTLWYSILLAVPLIAFAVVSYLVFSQSLTGRTDEFLAEALAVFGNELTVERRQLPSVEEAVRITVHEVRFQDLDIVVLDEEGSAMASSPPLPGADAREPDGVTLLASSLDRMPLVPGSDVSRVWTLTGSGGPYRVRIEALELGPRFLALAGIYPLGEVENTLRRIRHLFALVIPLMILAAATGGWFLARRSLRPISHMAARAEEIGATTLHERIPTVADDELGSLARVLNDLLDRLESSFEQQRRFVADASHELRSPTAILRSEADITLSREHRTEEEYREALSIIKDAARRLSRVVDDMFLLARVDGGQPILDPAPLYLDELISDTVRVASPLAQGRGVRLVTSGSEDVFMRGDPDLLGRLLLNLLDNAIRHTPEGGEVRVGLTETGGGHRISVVDPGPGIPSGVQGRVFERFFQVSSARDRDGDTLTSGAGLGLSIAQRIAEMHGGRLEVAESRPGRTEFVVSLPMDPPV